MSLCLALALVLLPLIVFAEGEPAETNVERPVAFHPRGDETLALEGLVRIPEGAAACRGVVICHPDPRYEGSMEAPVVAHLQHAFAEARYATLRFNLRGVGASTGEFDEGKGEVLDCLGALDFLRSQPRIDPKRVALVAYSFGAWVGLQACVRDGKLPACGCLAFPVPENEDITKHTYFKQIASPTLFVTGTGDIISSLKTIRRIVEANGVEKHCRIIGIEDADHFFWSEADLAAAAQHLVAFITKHLARGATEQGP